MTAKNFAFFISPHGFGHAARACAVMTILARAIPDTHFSIYTKVPPWFFKQSFGGAVSFSYHELLSDVGFVQATSIQEDYDATIRALSELYPLRDSLIASLGAELRAKDTRAVLCDISVLGLAAARHADIPSVLFENFTWDWIYNGYLDVEPRFATFIEYLRPLYDLATVRVQAEPVGVPRENAITVPPLARPIRSAPESVRDALKIPRSAPMILCTMGGVPGEFSFVDALGAHPEVFFALAGINVSEKLPRNVRAISHTSSLYHPDLVAAANAVVGKVGYSTVAEAYYGRTQFFFLPRPRFPESKVMENFVSQELCGVRIPPDDFQSGRWVATLLHNLKAPSPLTIDAGLRDTRVAGAVQRLIAT